MQPRRNLASPESHERHSDAGLDEQANAGAHAKRKETVPKKRIDVRSEFLLSSEQYGDLWVQHIVGDSKISLADRLKVNADPTAPPKVILSWDAGHTSSNLNGCREWRCEFTANRNDIDKADAVLISTDVGDLARRRRPEQYLVFFSQESPVNSQVTASVNNFFNLSLGYRRDSPSSSPYGYTVKLAPRSQGETRMPSEKLLNGKDRPLAWFVSNCGTFSLREQYVAELRVRYFSPDRPSHEMILSQRFTRQCNFFSYYFYLAFENSVCYDYTTEKVWNKGFKHYVVPIVLKRSILQPYAPPHSFIAADDFHTVKEMADYLKYLMLNKTAYREYFNWRQKYFVVFLDGARHDQLERPWGFCQLCRLLWQKPQEEHIIVDFKKWWSDSCETSGQLVQRILQNGAEQGKNFSELPKNVVSLMRLS
ncbi:unnamed protein product [Toxocara canis]|uniref:Fucosyltransferase n=1 Tax=Toxocara canis TaxID=6265 RepID=A0A3P7G6W4_TOXCA|nr:unnamed protein product [Toxocara canis]